LLSPKAADVITPAAFLFDHLPAAGEHRYPNMPAFFYRIFLYFRIAKQKLSI
jgi:hypothetical protein